MRVNRLDAAADDLADPGGAGWSAATPEIVPLAGTSISDQPSSYLRGAYSSHEPGTVEQVEVKVAEADSELLIRIEWSDETEDRAHRDRCFPDAAAAMFPLGEDAPFESMGTEEQPVALWYWRPDLDTEADELTASGLGTVEPIEATDDDQLTARSCHEDGRWAIVLRRSTLTSAPDRVDLSAGSTARMALAIWDGSAQERGGFKSTSIGWQMLEREGEA